MLDPIVSLAILQLARLQGDSDSVAIRQRDLAKILGVSTSTLGRKLSKAAVDANPLLSSLLEVEYSYDGQGHRTTTRYRVDLVPSPAPLEDDEPIPQIEVQAEPSAQFEVQDAPKPQIERQDYIPENTSFLETKRQNEGANGSMDNMDMDPYRDKSNSSGLREASRLRLESQYPRVHGLLSQITPKVWPERMLSTVRKLGEDVVVHRLKLLRDDPWKCRSPERAFFARTDDHWLQAESRVAIHHREKAAEEAKKAEEAAVRSPTPKISQRPQKRPEDTLEADLATVLPLIRTEGLGIAMPLPQECDSSTLVLRLMTRPSEESRQKTEQHLSQITKKRVILRA